MKTRDVMNYNEPKGPLGQDHKGPGLGGTNHGKTGAQGGSQAGRESGSPGLGGEVRRSGTQHGG